MYLADEYRDLDYILTSPFLRAKETTNLILEEFDTVDQGERTLPTVVVEERLREIEFGIMDGIDRKKFREQMCIRDSCNSRGEVWCGDCSSGWGTD